MREQWFSPREITFTPGQVIFLIRNLIILGWETWPPDPLGSGYVEAPISKRKIKPRAYFETVCQFRAEVMSRLSKTGRDGQTLLEEIYAGLLDMELLSGVARSALYFISGWARKESSYSNWLKQRIYRGNKNEKASRHLDFNKEPSAG